MSKIAVGSCISTEKKNQGLHLSLAIANEKILNQYNQYLYYEYL